MRPSPALVAVVLGVFLLTGCGGTDDGGDGGEETAGGTLTKAEFIAQGDAICDTLEAESEEVAAPTDETEGFAAFIREVAALGETAREDFAALDAPEDGQPVQQALLDAIDSSLETIEGAAVAAEDGDTVTAGDLLAQAGEEGDAAGEQARAYGFQSCADESEGTDEATAGGTGEGSSKEEFIASGDAVCQQLADVTASVAAPVDETDLARYLDEVLPLAADAREAFASLTPPEDGVQVQQELLAALDATIEAGAAASIAAGQGDTVTAGDLLTQAGEAGDAANASAQAYGFQQCGNDAG